MNLEEAKKIARSLLDKNAASYENALQLAEYVLGLIPGTNIIEIDDTEADTLPPEPYDPSPSVAPSAPTTPIPPPAVPPDKACKRCGAYTTTAYCSKDCAAGLPKRGA